MLNLAAALNVFVKASLLGLVAYSVLAADLPQFEDKAMAVRQAFFPLALLIVPTWWFCRRRRPRYPHVLDAMIVAPFAFDLFGNATNLYNEYGAWDDLVHTLNPIVFGAAAAYVARAVGTMPWSAFLISTGLGSTGHILFELIEYRLYVSGNERLNLTLANTISDLGWGVLGSLIGAVLGLMSFARTDPNPRETVPE